MKKNSNFIQSLICAFKGIIHVINAEKNFLVSAFISIIVGLLIFIPKIIVFIGD